MEEAYHREPSLQTAILLLIVAAGCAPRQPGAWTDAAPPARQEAGPQDTQSRAFLDFRSRTLEYSGAGREQPDPEGLTELRIGWFGPTCPEGVDAGPWHAACLAVEEANARGGFDGVPFRLVPAWSENPWSNGASLVARLAYADRVWAIIGSVDGPSTHLAEQVVAKARLPLISPISSDKSVNLAGVSWTFSCTPGDHAYAPLLARYVLEHAGDGDFALLVSTDHDSRVAGREVMKALARAGRLPSRRLDVHHSTRDFDVHLGVLRELRPAVLVVLAGARQSAQLVRAVRRDGFEGEVVGAPAVGRAEFLELAADVADGVRFPLYFDASAPGALTGRFVNSFRSRVHRLPDYAEAFTYDATTLLIAAVRRAGLNRARIRDAVAALSPWSGVCGKLRFDGTGQNVRPVEEMAVVRRGQVRRLSSRA